MYKYYLQDIGPGWCPVVLSDQREADFMKQALRSFSDKSSCWIGGSTDTDPGSLIDFDSYLSGSRGNDNI